MNCSGNSFLQSQLDNEIKIWQALKKLDKGSLGSWKEEAERALKELEQNQEVIFSNMSAWYQKGHSLNDRERKAYGEVLKSHWENYRRLQEVRHILEP